MFNVELTLEELQELHLMLSLRKVQLQDELKHKNLNIVAISMRQLERVSPLHYYFEAMVKEYHEQTV